MAIFTLPVATTGRWLGLNPYMHPLPIPVYVSLVFPPGQYEIGFTGTETRWRYLGPHFSKPATGWERNGNTIAPVGAEGEYCFQGGWVPSGVAIGATPQRLIDEQARLYADMMRALQQNRIGSLLALMIKRRGL